MHFPEHLSELTKRRGPERIYTRYKDVKDCAESGARSGAATELRRGTRDRDEGRFSPPATRPLSALFSTPETLRTFGRRPHPRAGPGGGERGRRGRDDPVGHAWRDTAGAREAGRRTGRTRGRSGRGSRGHPRGTGGDTRGAGRAQENTRGDVPRQLTGQRGGGGGVPGPAGAVRAPAAAPGFSWEISPSPSDVSPVPGCRRRGRAGGRAGRTGTPAAPAAPRPSPPSCSRRHPRARLRPPPGRAFPPPPPALSLGAASCSQLHGPCPLNFLRAGVLVRGGRDKERPLFFFFFFSLLKYAPGSELQWGGG